ncbi:MAG: GTPase domain-containing protein [Gammaproteobacteria bacterium]|nr:GTPase domain-containing protein [Gammaproteobacteria bacterium]MBU1977746.1 GTPase domain-containing protein [Gammaproteobacteria bacterium]
MAEFDEVNRKITIKLVYYGPAQSGKTTNLMRLHDLLAPDLKGEIMTLETQNDRTLFFDLLPLGFRTPSGWLVKLKLFTVPGQVAHDATRKAVLSRADGVVFVADSQRSQSVNNAEAFQNLEENVQRVGMDFSHMPLVVQFNKRDLPEAQIFSENEIRQRWSQTPWPLVFSSALVGEGVRETLFKLLEQVYPALDRLFGLQQEHDVGQQAFISAVLGD